VDSSNLEEQLGIGADLVKVLRNWKEGNEPLGRTMLSDLTSPPAGHISSHLHPEIQSTMLTFDVGCDEADVMVNGIRAVSFVTDMHTTKPLDQFERVVNPFKWPGCWLESFFFKAMVAGEANATVELTPNMAGPALDTLIAYKEKGTVPPKWIQTESKLYTSADDPQKAYDSKKGLGY